MLFGEHFGADRISDMVCNIAMESFVDYTQEIAAHHGLPVKSHRLRHVGYDLNRNRWRSQNVDLPANPCWDPSPGVLLVPAEVLDELPKMDDQQFWDWVYDHQNEQLRKDLGYEITHNLERNEILARARGRVDLSRRYGVMYAQFYRDNPAQAYDLSRDPANKLVAFRTGEQFADLVQVTPPSSPDDFCSFVRNLVIEFKTAVEDRGIWRSFWHGGVLRREAHAQAMFHMCVYQRSRH